MSSITMQRHLIFDLDFRTATMSLKELSARSSILHHETRAPTFNCTLTVLIVCLIETSLWKQNSEHPWVPKTRVVLIYRRNAIGVDADWWNVFRKKVMRKKLEWTWNRDNVWSVLAEENGFSDLVKILVSVCMCARSLVNIPETRKARFYSFHTLSDLRLFFIPVSRRFLGVSVPLVSCKFSRYSRGQLQQGDSLQGVFLSFPTFSRCCPYILT